MHELGLASSILDIVRQYVPAERGPGLGRVHVRIGERAGVLTESLAFCFGAIVQGTPYAGATLHVTTGSDRELVVSELEVAE